MIPIPNTMIGCIVEEPKRMYHGPYVGNKMTFFLDVRYPNKKAGYADPYAKIKWSDHIRRFPFIVPREELQIKLRKGSPWKGQFVAVTYYLDVTNENSGDYHIHLYATQICNVIQDFPKAKVNEGRLWVDLNAIEEEIPDVEI